MRPHLIHELEPDKAIGPSRRLVHEEAHLVATKFVQIILEDVDTASPDDYPALSPLFSNIELLIPLGAEFNALSPHKL